MSTTNHHVLDLKFILLIFNKFNIIIIKFYTMSQELNKVSIWIKKRK